MAIKLKRSTGISYPLAHIFNVNRRVSDELGPVRMHSHPWWRLFSGEDPKERLIDSVLARTLEKKQND